jgi:hypothetical protein
MRKLRVLAADNPAQTAQRFEPSTAVNNREPFFWSPLEKARFERVPNEARELYAFALCGLCFNGPTVRFYIKPADGFKLPEIMQWIKQTYSVRHNVYDGRTGHIWGDRYASKIVAGDCRRMRRNMYLCRWFARRGAECGGAGRVVAEAGR